MALVANYRGDVRHIVGEIKGPDNTDHGFVRAVEADYSPDIDRTLVRFQPVVIPAELAEVLEAGDPAALAHLAETAR